MDKLSNKINEERERIKSELHPYANFMLAALRKLLLNQSQKWFLITFTSVTVHHNILLPEW